MLLRLLLNCLLIGLGLCQNGQFDSLSIQDNIRGDTRNISSHLFKPLKNTPNTEPIEPSVRKGDKRFLDTFEQQAEVRPVISPTSEEEDDEDDRDVGPWPPIQSFPDNSRFINPPRNPSNFNRQPSFRSPGDGPGTSGNYYDPRIVTRPLSIPVGLYMSSPNGIQQVTTTGRFGGSSFGGSSFGQTSFGGSSSGGPSLGGPSFGGSNFGGPSFGRSSSGGPSFSGSNIGGPSFGGPNLGSGSSNNYYRSESYSYSSDGMGAPQIQQSVFDSRLGYQNNQNF